MPSRSAQLLVTFNLALGWAGDAAAALTSAAKQDRAFAEVVLAATAAIVAAAAGEPVDPVW